MLLDRTDNIKLETYMSRHINILYASVYCCKVATYEYITIFVINHSNFLKRVYFKILEAAYYIVSPNLEILKRVMTNTSNAYTFFTLK